MKKYLVSLVLFVLLGAFSNVFAQNSELPKGVDTMLNGKIRFCNYEEAYLFTDVDKKFRTTGLEISYDGTGGFYEIHVKCMGDVMNFRVKYVSGDKGAYAYEGVDRITDRKVVVVTKEKLSLYTNNHGIDSAAEAESPKGIIVTVPATYTVFSVVPIKNK